MSRLQILVGGLEPSEGSEKIHLAGEEKVEAWASN